MFNKIKNHIFSLHEKVELLILYGIVMFGLGMVMNYFISKSSDIEKNIIAVNELDERSYPYDGKKVPAAETGYSEYVNDIVVSENDHLAKILMREGVGSSEAYYLTTAVQKKYDLRNLKVGQKITAIFKEKIDDNSGEVILSNLTIHEADRDIEVVRENEKTFNVLLTNKELYKELVHVSGVINTSLYMLASKLGVSANIISDFMNAYSYDVDFQRDIKKGSKFDIMYEVLFDDNGNQIRNGNLIYGSLTVHGKDLKIYRYSASGKGRDADFYNEKGKKLRKFLLKTPISGAVISSPFGRRRHPISGYSKMHKGVDFAAKRNTPFYAAGDGKIVYIGRNGGYGNYIRIKHDKTFETAYGHINRFAKGMRKGRSVKQGQIIAYVGSTGNSTGPHLHYEILKNGKQINPMRLKIPSGLELKGGDLKKFTVRKNKIDLILQNQPIKKIQNL